MTSVRDVQAASPTQEPLIQRMGDSGVAEYADRASLLTDIQGDYPSDIGEKTLMVIQEGSTKSFSSESAPIEGEDQIPTTKEGSIYVNTPSEKLLRVFDFIITPEGRAMEIIDSDTIVDVCKRSGSSGSQLLMETSILQTIKEVPLHHDASGAEKIFISQTLFL